MPSSPADIPLHNAPPSTVATTLLFGSITFATATLASRLWLTGLWKWRYGGSSPQSAPLDVTSFPSIYSLLSRCCTFGFILLYSYICENHPPFAHEEKSMYDRDEFLCTIVLVVGVAGARSWRRNGVAAKIEEQPKVQVKDDKPEPSARDIINNARHRYLRDDDNSEIMDEPTTAIVAPPPLPENEVLNRKQTEEWKGWMQFIFLLYHYVHATEVYNVIRVLITCYVWLTGFGNFSFFHKTNDYSLPRILQMLWRLNFLVVFLCLTHGNSYILYYICPLHTFYFLMVYAVMYIGNERNHNTWFMRSKLGVLAVIIFLVWDNNSGIFEGVHRLLLLGDKPMAGAPFGSLWEWYFRSYLDHWSALLGMVFALNLPVVSLFYRKLEARSFGRQWIGKLSVMAGMMYAFSVWLKAPFMLEKEYYNRTNPYLGFVPLLFYIYTRNLTPTMRSHAMQLLQEIGKTTLETYLMQHHIWLTSNSKTLLVFLPNFPRSNMLLVTLFYVVICRKLHNLTIELRNALLPNDRKACMQSLLAIGLLIAGFYFTAVILSRMHSLSLAAIGIISTICGGLLYQTVLDSTWYEYHSSVKKAREEEDEEEDETKSFFDKSEVSYSTAGDIGKESIVSKMCPPIIGFMFLFVIGSIWNQIAVAGAGAVGPLPSDCGKFANKGQWIQVDGCSESYRGMAYREYHVAVSGTCSRNSGSYIWVWEEQPARTRCRFGNRGAAKLRRMLNGRHLIFIGDSMTRNMYHASLRAMGTKEAGSYDATIPKHTDLSETMFDTAQINFKWAPLAVDQLNSLKGINNAVTNSGDAPDLIVMGGGAWDRLHVFATDEDRQSHASTLKDLASEMLKSQKLAVPVVWIIPTTINSQALNTEEKRDHMREEDMEAMRAVYSLNGILNAASFVIDGTAFTASRVSESFDGVHYPHQIYDAGAQIFFQSLDWLSENTDEIGSIPRVGKLSNPPFGILMMALVAIALISFDGFLGFSYLASFFVKGVKPSDLYNEACPESDKKGTSNPSLPAQRNHTQAKSRHLPTFSRARRTVAGNVDDEIAALLR